MNILHSKIAIIIPCYKVYPHLICVLEELNSIPWNQEIFIIDDSCPLNSIKKSLEIFKLNNNKSNLKYTYIKTPKNIGVGGAWLLGLNSALDQDYEYFLKLDGDNQHKFSSINTKLQDDILECKNEYLIIKGNRFFSQNSIKKIPKLRLLGNIGLSFLSRLSSGNWEISDPICGCFVISRGLANKLLTIKIERRFLFESDLLHQCSKLNADIYEFPLLAIYGNEISNLNEFSHIPIFLWFHLKALLDRIIYDHLVKGMTPEGIFFAGFLFCVIASFVILIHIYLSFLSNGLQTPTGTIVMLLLLCQSGLIFFVNFLKEDSSSYHDQKRRSRASFEQKS